MHACQKSEKKGLPFLFIPNKCKQNKCWKYKNRKKIVVF